MSLWFDSYKNHILHCTIYTTILATICTTQSSLLLPPLALLLPSSSSSTSSGLSITRSSSAASSYSSSWWSISSTILAGSFALLSLIFEINFIMKRIGMPPGDSGLPIVGHFWRLVTIGPREYKLKMFQKYGSIYTQNLIMKPSIVIYSEEDVRWWILQERKGNVVPHMIPHFTNLLGEEAIMMQSSVGHKRLRRIFEPSFSPSSVQGYTQIMDDTVQDTLEKWCAKNDFCASKDWAKLAMRLFFVCAFGGGDGSDGSDGDGAVAVSVDEDWQDTLNQLFDTWIGGFVSLFPFPIPGTRLYKAYAARKEMGRILLDTINQFKSQNPPGSTGAEQSMMGRLCYGVDEDGNPLTDSQLVTNIIFILFAGHDTTKGSFCAFVYYLTKYPNLRKLLVQEVQSFQEPLDTEELKAAPLLNAFMAETWRLVPPLDSHNVRAEKDLDFKGYKIRAGTGISIDIQAFNVMEENGVSGSGSGGGGGNSNAIYKDPLEFRIERWLPEGHPMYDPQYFQKGVDYNIMSPKYRAFHMGPHMCLGAHFAKLEARIVLTRLLQNYDLEIRNNELTSFPLLQYSNEFKLTKRSK